MCGPDEFIYDFMRDASSPERDMVNGEKGEYMYLSVRTTHYDIVHPWSVREGHSPSDVTLKAYRNLMQVTRTELILVIIYHHYHHLFAKNTYNTMCKKSK